MRSRRYVLAFSLAPAVPGLLLGVAAMISGLVKTLGDALTLAAFAAVIAYPTALALGLPVVVLLLDFKRMKLQNLLLAAAFIGCIPGVVLGGISNPLSWLFFAAMGVVTALAWWWISGVSSATTLDDNAA